MKLTVVWSLAYEGATAGKLVHRAGRGRRSLEEAFKEAVTNAQPGTHIDIHVDRQRIPARVLRETVA